jgi:hypothetical protein
MKMYYCKLERPNFGDDLNVWLWPRLLPDFFDEDESTMAMTMGNKKWSGRLSRRAGVLRRVAPNFFIERAAESLSRLARIAPSLSADKAIARARIRQCSRNWRFCAGTGGDYSPIAKVGSLILAASKVHLFYP